MAMRVENRNSPRTRAIVCAMVLAPTLLCFAGCAAEETIAPSSLPPASVYVLRENVIEPTPSLVITAEQVSDDVYLFSAPMKEGTIVYAGGQPYVIQEVLVEGATPTVRATDPTSLHDIFESLEAHFRVPAETLTRQLDPSLRRIGFDECVSLKGTVTKSDGFSFILGQGSYACFEGDFVIDISLSKNSIEFAFEGAIDLQLNFEVDADFGSTWSEDIVLFRFPPIPWTLGVLSGDVQFELLVDLEVGTSTEVTARWSTDLRLETEAGFSYEQGRFKYGRKKSISTDAQVTELLGPVPSLSADFGLKGRGTLAVYKLAGPYIELGPSLHAELRQENCSIDSELLGVISAEAGLRVVVWPFSNLLPKFEKKLFSASRTLLRERDYLCDSGQYCSNERCVDCKLDIHCNDARFCNGLEKCRDGVCKRGENPCRHDEFCDDDRNECVVCLEDDDCPVDGECWESECDGGECSTHFVCECSPTIPCDDGLFCNGEESCRDGVCQDGLAPCAPSQRCDEVADRCDQPSSDEDDEPTDDTDDECSEGQCDPDGNVCKSDSDCEDQLFCNGEETCIDGRCGRHSTPCLPGYCVEEEDRCLTCIGPADCDDGDPRTVDRCNLVADSCEHDLECATGVDLRVVFGSRGPRGMDVSVIDEGLRATSASGFGWVGEFYLPGESFITCEFHLPQTPCNVELSLRHATRRKITCDAGGYSPISVWINDILLFEGFDPARNNEGSYRLRTDDWQIEQLLVTGSNTVTISYDDDACSPYWISEIVFHDD